MELERFFAPSRELDASEILAAMIKAKRKTEGKPFCEYYNEYCAESFRMSKYPPKHEATKKEGINDSY